jgi:lysyl-tRNA synthetase class 2
VSSVLRERLARKARFHEDIRRFFASEGYVEVDTPILSPALIPEAAIEVFKTSLSSARGRPRDFFLAPSPELWMKRLIAGGSGSIFQISPAFRNGDLGSPIHNPEFRILEWYSVGSSYTDCIPVTERLVSRLLEGMGFLDRSPAVSPPFSRMTMEEAFRRHAGMDLASCGLPEDLLREGDRLGITMPEDPTWEEAFHVIFLSVVEPDLPRERPLVLLDYPALIPTTARRKAATPFSERWELYINGVEIANCYTEETDPAAIRRFLRGEEARKKRSLVSHPTDEGFAAVFDKGFPACAGVALGLERLEMVLSAKSSLEGVILFPLSVIL